MGYHTTFGKGQNLIEEHYIIRRKYSPINVYKINYLFILIFLTLLSCKSIERFNNSEPIVSVVEYSVEQNYKIKTSKKDSINNYYDYYNPKNNFILNKDLNTYKHLTYNTHFNENHLPLTIFIIDNLIYDFDYKSNLKIYDSISGDIINKIKLNINLSNEFSYPTSISFIDNLFITSYSDGTLVKFDIDGNIIWQIQINDIIKTPIKIHDKNIILLTSNKIYAVNINNGSFNWNFTYENNNRLNTQRGSITSFNNILYFLLPNGRLGEIDTLISTKNNSTFTNLVPEQSYFENKYFFHKYENTISFFVNKKYLYTYDLNKNEFILEKFNIDNIRSFDFIDNALITIDQNNIMFAHNLINENIFWQTDLSELINENLLIKKIINQDNMIIIFFNNGQILYFDAQYGVFLKKYDLKIKNIESIDLLNNYIIINQNNTKRIFFKQQ